MNFEELNTNGRDLSIGALLERDVKTAMRAIDGRVYFTPYVKGKKVCDVARFFITGSDIASIRIRTSDEMDISCFRMDSDAEMKRLKIFDDYQIENCWIDGSPAFLTMTIKKEEPSEAPEPKKKSKKK